MQRDLFASWKTEPDAVFENLEWTRIIVDLNESDREKAITLIKDVLHKTQDEDDKPHVLLLIAYSIRYELFKSKEIDVEMIQKLAQWHPRCVEIDDDYTNYGWVTAYEDFKLIPDSKEEEEEEDDDDDDADDEYYEDEGKEEVVDEGNFNDDFLERVEAMKRFEGAGMKELKRRFDMIGCSLKQGQDHQMILYEMISFFCQQNFIIPDDYTMKSLVEDFMSRVKGYISSTCILNDVSTVRKAIQTVEKRMEVEALQTEETDADPSVHQQLEFNTVPANEVGVEGHVMIPLSLPEQDEICLTPPESEDMETENMNQPEQEKNMVDLNLCLPPLGEDMKTEESTNWQRAKRKLAQL